MMRQAENPVQPLHLGQAHGSAVQIDISKEERVDILVMQSKDVVLKSSGKKNLILKLVIHRTSILEHAVLFDALGNSNLEECLSRMLPKTKSACNKDNKELATKITELSDACKLLHSHLKSQEHQMEQSVAHLRQRQSARPRDSALVVLEELAGVMDAVDSAVLIKRNSSDNDAKLRSVSLNAAQRERSFDRNRVPNDEAIQCCLFCGCASINEPPENAEVLINNKRVADEFETRNKLWTRYLADKEKNERVLKPKDPITKKEMKRGPTRGKYKSQILQCMCSTSKCVVQGSDISSTCPIKCIDPCTKERFHFTGFPTPSCSCTICNCTCSMAYHAKDIAVVSLKLMQKDNANQRNSSSASSSGNAMQSVHTFLGGFMASGMHAAYSSMHNEIQEKVKGKKISEDDIMRRTDQIQYEATAENIARKGGHGGLGSAGREVLANAFGTSTIVTLPQGNLFDTNAVGGNSNFHARNNRLLGGRTSGVEGPTIYQGMTSNLEIDYANPNQAYIDALSGKNSPAVVNLVSPKPAAALKRPPIELLEDTDDEDDMNKKIPAMPSLPRGFTQLGPSPNKHAWERMKVRNRSLLHLDKRGAETPGEKESRKKAKKIGKHMLQNESNYKDIVTMITDESFGINTGQFESQDLLGRYEDGYMTEDEE